MLEIKENVKYIKKILLEDIPTEFLRGNKDVVFLKYKNQNDFKINQNLFHQNNTKTVLLPSEVKYSSSLVGIQAICHLIIGVTLFSLGILGCYIEPELNWAGSGIWCGLIGIVCGIFGLFARYYWYKNWTIKMYLLTSVLMEAIFITGFIITVYSLLNKNYFIEYSPPDHYPEHIQYRKSLTITINMLIGKIFGIFHSGWSIKISWDGVKEQEFSTQRRNQILINNQNMVYEDVGNINTFYHVLNMSPSMNSGGFSLIHFPSQLSMTYEDKVTQFFKRSLNTSRSTITIESESSNGLSEIYSKKMIRQISLMEEKSLGDSDEIVSEKLSEKSKTSITANETKCSELIITDLEKDNSEQNKSNKNVDNSERNKNNLKEDNSEPIIIDEKIDNAEWNISNLKENNSEPIISGLKDSVESNTSSKLTNNVTRTPISIETCRENIVKPALGNNTLNPSKSDEIRDHVGTKILCEDKNSESTAQCKENQTSPK